MGVPPKYKNKVDELTILYRTLSKSDSTTGSSYTLVLLDSLPMPLVYEVAVFLSAASDMCKKTHVQVTGLKVFSDPVAYRQKHSMTIDCSGKLGIFERRLVNSVRTYLQSKLCVGKSISDCWLSVEERLGRGGFLCV